MNGAIATRRNDIPMGFTFCDWGEYLEEQQKRDPYHLPHLPKYVIRRRDPRRLTYRGALEEIIDRAAKNRPMTLDQIESLERKFYERSSVQGWFNRRFLHKLFMYMDVYKPQWSRRVYKTFVYRAGEWRHQCEFCARQEALEDRFCVDNVCVALRNAIFNRGTAVVSMRYSRSRNSIEGLANYLRSRKNGFGIQNNAQ